MNTIETFLQKIDKVAHLLELGDTESLKTDLLTSVYLDLTTKIGVDPRNRQFLDEIASKKQASVEEFNQKMAFAQEKLKTTGFDVNNALTESSKSVLESFVSKLEPKFTPEKITELRKMVFE